jgi:hypothetical protein
VATPLRKGFSGFRQHMLSTLLPANVEKKTPPPAPITLLSYGNMEYHARTVMLLEDRCFYIIKRGYIGLSPKGIMPGDVISVLAWIKRSLCNANIAARHVLQRHFCHLGNILSGERFTCPWASMNQHDKSTSLSGNEIVLSPAFLAIAVM